MIKVNLLPEQQARGKAAKKKTSARPRVEIPVTWIIIGLASVLATSVILGMIHWSRDKKAQAINVEIQSVDAEIKKMGLEIRKVEEFKRQKEDLETKLNVILQLKVQQKGPVHVLDQLASAIPPRLWIKEFTENGTSMTIVGSTADHSQISAFMDNLEKSPFFSNVELGSAMVAEGSKAGTSSGQLLKTFQLTSAVQIPKELN